MQFNTVDEGHLLNWMWEMQWADSAMIMSINSKFANTNPRTGDSTQSLIKAAKNNLYNDLID